MLHAIVTAKQVEELFELEGSSQLDKAVAQGILDPAPEDDSGTGFHLADLITWKLAAVMMELGVEAAKAKTYARTILGPRLTRGEKSGLEWIEDSNQELHCLLEDKQLARIYLRDKENRTEADVGAVKPVLLPTTRCEINVSRVVRPIVYWAKQTLGPV